MTHTFYPNQKVTVRRVAAIEAGDDQLLDRTGIVRFVDREGIVITVDFDGNLECMVAWQLEPVPLDPFFCAEVDAARGECPLCEGTGQFMGRCPLCNGWITVPRAYLLSVADEAA